MRSLARAGFLTACIRGNLDVAGMEGQSSEDTVRRQLSTSKGERLQKEPTLPKR